jgi:hypothetical protein
VRIASPRCCRAVFFFLVSGLGALAYAQGAVSEYAMKSALLFKLPQFVYRGDAAAGAPVGLCVLGNNPFGGALEKLAQQVGDGKTVRISRLSTVGEAQDCDYVFVSRSESIRLDAVLKRIGRPSLVTVSDIEGFARAGGMVEFALSDEGAGISILINRKAAQRQNIEFNAQLLRLAKVVEP